MPGGAGGMQDRGCSGMQGVRKWHVRNIEDVQNLCERSFMLNDIYALRRPLFCFRHKAARNCFRSFTTVALV